MRLHLSVLKGVPKTIINILGHKTVVVIVIFVAMLPLDSRNYIHRSRELDISYIRPLVEVNKISCSRRRPRRRGRRREHLCNRSIISSVPFSPRFGHSKPSITLDVYGHLIPSKQEEAAQLMDHLMSDGIGATAPELHQNYLGAIKKDPENSHIWVFFRGVTPIYGS